MPHGPNLLELLLMRWGFSLEPSDELTKRGYPKYFDMWYGEPDTNVRDPNYVGRISCDNSLSDVVKIIKRWMEKQDSEGGPYAGLSKEFEFDV